MPKRLHYLRLADYGKDSIVASTAIFDNDPSIATRVVSVGVHTPSCTFIADFCIDLAHPIRVIGSTSHSRSLHAEFTVLEGAAPCGLLVQPRREAAILDTRWRYTLGSRRSWRSGSS